MSRLAKYIVEYGGDEKVAAAVGAKKRTVQSWRLGSRRPGRGHASRLIKLADGYLSWADIYQLCEGESDVMV